MLIGCLIAVIIMLAGGAALEIREIRGIHERLDNYDRAVSDLFTARDPNQNPPFIEIVDKITDMFAQKQAITTQAAIRGSMGGSQKAINAELERIAIEENPDLALTKMLPNSLKKNDLALQGLKFLVGRMRSSGGSGGNHHPGEQVKFKL